MSTSLTAEQLARLEALEAAVKSLTILLSGAGSKNQLNRLYVLGQNTNEGLEVRVEALETKMDEILTYCLDFLLIGDKSHRTCIVN